MAKTKRRTAVRVLTRAEYRALLEKRVEDYLHMSLPAFNTARRKRKLRDGALTAHLELLLGERAR